MLNRIFTITTILATLLFASSATAQTTELSEGLNVVVNEFEQIGDSLYVDMDVVHSAKVVDAQGRVELTPAMTTDNLNHKFDPITIYGSINYMSHKRKIALMDSEQRAKFESESPVGTTIIENRDFEPSTINYNIALPYEEWMADAQLTILNSTVYCGKPIDAGRTYLGTLELEPHIEDYVVSPEFIYVQPKAEEIKKRSTEYSINFNFKVADTRLQPSHGNNQQQIDELAGYLGDVMNDKTLDVKQIIIYGYASPEGPEKLNERLAEGRAQTIVDLVVSRKMVPRNLVSTEYRGEDWQGLVDVLNGGTLPYAADIVSIIEGTENVASRKSKVKSYEGGAPYREMLSTIYPPLRRSKFYIDYQVKPFDVEEAKEVFKTKPQNLSLNEMYHVANTYEQGSDEFRELFDKAVELFPDDPTANINAAISAIQAGNFERADRFLSKLEELNSVGEVAELDNARGVLLLLRERDVQSAEPLLRRASEAGIKEADANIAQMEKLAENLSAIKAVEDKRAAKINSRK